MNPTQAAEAVKAFGQHFDYDVSYLQHMLEASPEAFGHFWKLNEMSAHRGVVPLAADVAVKLVGTLAEDCGPCVPLGVRMAEAAGVDPGQIVAVLTRNVAVMSPDVAAAFAFADALVRHDPGLDGAREEVRARWGDAGVVDLALGAQLVRLFPMVKLGLGYGKACQRVSVAGRSVEVVKAA